MRDEFESKIFLSVVWGEKMNGSVGCKEGEEKAYRVWKSVWSRSFFDMWCEQKMLEQLNCFKDRKQEDKSYWFVVGITDRSAMKHADQY